MNIITTKATNAEQIIAIINSPATTKCEQNNFDFVITQKIVDTLTNTTTATVYSYTAVDRAEKSNIATAIANKPAQPKTTTAPVLVKLPKKADYIASKQASATADQIEKRCKVLKLEERIAKLQAEVDQLKTDLATTVDYAKQYAELYAKKMAEASKTKDGKQALAKIATDLHLDKDDIKDILEGALAKTLTTDFDKQAGKKIIKALEKLAIEG